MLTVLQIFAIIIFLIILIFVIGIIYLVNRKYDKLTCTDLNPDQEETIELLPNHQLPKSLRLIIPMFNKLWKPISKQTELEPWEPVREFIDREFYRKGDFFDASKLLSQFTKCIGCSVNSVYSDAGKLTNATGFGNIIIYGVANINEDATKASLCIGLKDDTKLTATIKDMKIKSWCECNRVFYTTKKQPVIAACDTIELTCEYCNPKYIATVDFILPDSLTDWSKCYFGGEQGEEGTINWSKQTPIVTGEFNCSGIPGVSTFLTNTTGTSYATEMLQDNIDWMYESVECDILWAMNSVLKYFPKGYDNTDDYTCDERIIG